MLRKLLNRFRKKKNNKQQTQFDSNAKFTGNFQRDEKLLRDTFRDCDDVKYKKIYIPSMNGRQALLVYNVGLTNIDIFQRDIVTPLLAVEHKQVEEVTELISAGETKFNQTMQECAREILMGKTAILVAGVSSLLTLESKDWPMRAIEEPLQERLIRGPREGFVEVFKVNLSLIRRRLPDPMLKIKVTNVGRRTKTKVAILYLEDVCNLDVARKIKERINAIDIDGILDPGALTELIAERIITPFPLFLSTERPDKAVGGLLQGKVAIIVDGSPFVILVPAVMADFFQSPEDYYMHPLLATTGRLLRLAGLFMGTTLVAAYSAIISFHYEILPSEIVAFIAETREGVPFAPLTEALLLEFAVEILREASIRLPGPVGPTLSIVGALILGQAAVSARLVSPVMLIFAALSFIAGSIIPGYEGAMAIRWLRFPILIASGLL